MTTPPIGGTGGTNTQNTPSTPTTNSQIYTALHIIQGSLQSPITKKARFVSCNVPECKKKISSTQAIYSRCRCDGIFCPTHKLKHDCDFKYLEEQQAKLTAAMLNNQTKKHSVHHNNDFNLL
jgi:predicted nucleic acid binding AN1-type Zn finger protein